MPREIYLVKVGMTMTEGMVSEWFIDDGAPVSKGDMLYALETEKVNLDVDAEMDGIVKHSVAAGVMLAPGDVVGYIFGPEETIPADFAGVQSSSAPASTQSEVPAETVAVARDDQLSVAAVTAPSASEAAQGASGNEGSRTQGGRLKASPAARRLASELNVSIDKLHGSGPGGRIVEADVKAAADKGGSSQTQAVAARRSDPTNVSPLARRIAETRGIDLSLVQGSGPNGRILQADLDHLPTQASAQKNDADWPERRIGCTRSRYAKNNCEPDAPKPSRKCSAVDGYDGFYGRCGPLKDATVKRVGRRCQTDLYRSCDQSDC